MARRGYKFQKKRYQLPKVNKKLKKNISFIGKSVKKTGRYEIPKPKMTSDDMKVENRLFAIQRTMFKGVHDLRWMGVCHPVSTELRPSSYQNLPSYMASFSMNFGRKLTHFRLFLRFPAKPTHV